MAINTLPTTNKKLGVSYTEKQTTISVWAPTIENIKLALYDHPKALQRKLHEMHLTSEGVYEVTLHGDFHGYYYTFVINNADEITDPYSISTSANGTRSAIVDLAKTNPVGWEKSPPLPAVTPTDAIIYELHIKDFTMDKSTNGSFPGKYLGVCEEGTAFEGYATALDHLVDLGVTHVHLMPVYDFLTVDELSEDPNAYNWGYDPEHYNTPEGSYATNPQDPVSRILELKTLIMKLHNSGIRVVLDMVYNHTYRSEHSNFETLVPNYYYRMTPDGHFSNGSGCGNELASENPMVRRFIIDSLKYWLTEFKVDGFRFDLMALIDMVTLVTMTRELNDIKPGILIYGEPWMGGLSTLADNKRLYKGAQNGKGFALFNDEFRDALKGDNDGFGYGFVQGNIDFRYKTQIGILGSIPYDAQYIGFAQSPSETVNYFNSHDNLILYDKLKRTNASGDEDDLIRLNKLAFNILMLSQGIPFFHEGNEFLRTKRDHHNSYNAPMEINAIHWDDKVKHYAFYHYVKDLIALRKHYACFRMSETGEIQKRVHMYDHTEHIGHNTNVIAYSIIGLPEDDYRCLFIVHNAQAEDLILSISEIMKRLCEAYGEPIDTSTLKISQIFDSSGVRHEPLEIPYQSRHLLKMPRYSSAIYQFTI